MGRDPKRPRPQASRFSSRPSPSISVTTVSPAFSHCCRSGGRPAITPSGVPVKIRSPGFRVITREQKGFRPDEIIAYAFADVAIDKDRVVARGAAFRNRGEWYRLSYQCQTADEGLSIVSFSYTMGSRVPKDQWAEHFLVPQ